MNMVGALPQEQSYPVDVATNFFNNLATEIREFITKNGFWVSPRSVLEINPEGGRWLLTIREGTRI